MDWKQFGGSEKGAEKQTLCLMLEKATEDTSILNHRSIHGTKNRTNLESGNRSTNEEVKETFPTMGEYLEDVFI